MTTPVWVVPMPVAVFGVIVMTQLMTSLQHVEIGQRVRVRTGSCIGAMGVIANLEKGHTVRVRVRFDPPVMTLAAGLIGGVWLTSDGIERLE
jgi:hypothetical protein